MAMDPISETDEDEILRGMSTGASFQALSINTNPLMASSNSGNEDESCCEGEEDDGPPAKHEAEEPEAQPEPQKHFPLVGTPSLFAVKG